MSFPAEPQNRNNPPPPRGGGSSAASTGLLLVLGLLVVGAAVAAAWRFSSFAGAALSDDSDVPPPPLLVEEPLPSGSGAELPPETPPTATASAAPSGVVLTGTASMTGASVTGGNVANASAVVAGMSAGFRRCYNKGLAEKPNMAGSVRVTAKIGPNGEVLSVTTAGGQGLSESVIACVKARVSSAQFAPPEGGGATIVVPVTFKSQ